MNKGEGISYLYITFVFPSPLKLAGNNSVQREQDFHNSTFNHIIQMTKVIEETSD